MLVLPDATVTPGVTLVPTFMATVFEVTVSVPAQGFCAVSSSVIRSPCIRVVLEKLVAVPIVLPFTFHAYAGFKPPFCTLALKVTLVPEHIVLLLALMLTDGELAVFTIIATPFDDTDCSVPQAALPVITTLIISLLLSDDDV